MRGSLLSFLRREFRPAPGRADYALRLTLSCGVLILLFMTLQIPLLSVGIIVAFYASQSNIVTIKLLSIAFFFLVSVIIGIVILMLKFTYDYPLVRLVCSSILFLAAMFCMRIFDKLGLAFFIIALAVIFAQTFPSLTGNSELVIRMALWLWVAINTSVLVTLLVNACFRQAYPGYQFRQQLANDFSDCARQLASLGQSGETEARANAGDMAKQLTRLQELFQLACGSSPAIRRQQAEWQAMTGAAVHCYYLVMLIQPQVFSAQQQQLAGELSEYLRTLAAQCRGSTDLPADLPAAPQIRGDDVILCRLAAVCTRLSAGQPISVPEKAAGKAPLLVADAFTNPVYPQFALKTLLAALLCYLFYTATDWQGIHTIMLSCVIVAQPGLGPTMQKIWLRVGGALLASLLALALILFVQPYASSVTGLLAMSLPVMALAGWLAGGSERIAYAGIQIAFTFAMAFLDWFGPLYNLTELRDRVIGILLGVLVSSLIHLYLWPESEAPKLKQQLSRLFRQLGGWLAEDKAPQERQWMPLCEAILATEKLLDRVSAEPVSAWAYPHPELRNWPAEQSFIQALEILRLSEGYRLYSDGIKPFLPHCGSALQEYAAQIERTKASVLPPLPAAETTPYSQPLVRAIHSLPEWGVPAESSSSAIRITEP